MARGAPDDRGRNGEMFHVKCLTAKRFSFIYICTWYILWMGLLNPKSSDFRSCLAVFFFIVRVLSKLSNGIVQVLETRKCSSNFFTLFQNLIFDHLMYFSSLISFSFHLPSFFSSSFGWGVRCATAAVMMLCMLV